MNQKSFFDLLTRYHDGNCTEAEKLWVDKWYHNLNNRNFKDLSSTELNEMQDNIWLKINPVEAELKQPLKIKKLWPKFAIAASITVAFLIGGLYFSNYNPAEQSFMDENGELTLIEKTNDTNHSIIIALSDSSKITLNPKASITYPQVFASKERKVFLNGNAFFLVSKNPKRPFYVYNKHLVIRVLGTSFFVKECVNTQPAQVDVRTGKVQVNENEKATFFSLSDKKIAKPILLLPNQKGILSKHNLNKTLVEKPIPLAVAYNVPSNISYKFKEEKLKDLFSVLSEAYGIEIKSDDELVLNYTFTGDLSKKGLYEQLDLICGSISSKYYIQGTSIMVSNKN
ncbi:FecR family protein [Pedobacter fastidiosus]|uniref:FecR family protein n=1 Tax=Pedobacter fastidiosus TaxID=2765361 RepID=A0ABR7KNH2_9SPHI|nr:FecR family protein [Pedobacter fastidiosus]MBC6109631.1 FecR family protein [Pedobacter fastidiosus]